MTGAYWKLEDEKRIKGALGNLEEAARIIEDCLSRGPSVLSSTEVREAQTLTEATSVLLSYIKELR